MKFYRINQIGSIGKKYFSFVSKKVTLAKMNQKNCWYTVAGFEKGAIIKRLIFYQQI
jgi:hypothetical protein